ncbi:MAG: PH domain-containing protein [Alphaproteobacteria bacterium]|nr:PH domain-containing protein [Alphaproteobacteria bacterium]
MVSSGNAQIIREIINPDEQYIWDVTGSVADVKYNPIYLILSIVTLGIFLLILYFKRIFRAYVLTNQRLIVITGIFSKRVDEIELFRIVDSSTSQSLIDRWAGIGNIYVSSTDRTGDILMEKIPSPYLVRDSLRQNYTYARQKKGTVVLENLVN